jgi:hypothetical protein
MDITDIKIMTFGYILEQEKLTKNEKLQLLDFIKESTDIQLLNLLETGRMKTEKEILKEVKADWSDIGKHLTRAGQNLSKRGEDLVSNIPGGGNIEHAATHAYKALGPTGTAGVAALTAVAITAGVLAYKRFFSKAARACKDLGGTSKTACMNKYKAQGKKAEIATLNSKKGACKGNPKCVGKIMARIQKVSAEEKQLRASSK